MRGISKWFGAVQVLRSVDLELQAGEVLILAGENGAGKSTLIKILGGVHTEYEGCIELEDRPVRFRSPLEANAAGVAVIYQELSLVPSMTVADNIFLGRSLTRGGWMDDNAQRVRAQRLLDHLGIDINVSNRVEDLPIALQQMTEIAKALAQEARVIVMDEPTSALSAVEVDKLFGLIGDLKARGCGIVYITHKMEEIQRVADRVTVLRDGLHVGTAAASELPPDKLVNWMVGRDTDQQFPRHTPRIGDECIRLEAFSVTDRRQGQRLVVDSVSMSVRSGEIVGVAGLQGSGASELFLGIFGASRGRVSGGMLLNGKPVSVTSPRQAIDCGMALLTNDRKATGLVLSLSVAANATLAALPELSPGGWRSPVREAAAAEALGKTLSLRAASLEMEVAHLSGGNQQKVALAKWLETKPRLLMLDEPTRGIDVGAKREIYGLMNALTAQGIAIMLITSELPELLALSDRIVVMHRGRLTAELPKEGATAERVLEAAMGHAK